MKGVIHRIIREEIKRGAVIPRPDEYHSLSK
jgi:hypothetical protein